MFQILKFTSLLLLTSSFVFRYIKFAPSNFLFYLQGLECNLYRLFMTGKLDAVNLLFITFKGKIRTRRKFQKVEILGKS